MMVIIKLNAYELWHESTVNHEILSKDNGDKTNVHIL